MLFLIFLEIDIRYQLSMLFLQKDGIFPIEQHLHREITADDFDLRFGLDSGHRQITGATTGIEYFVTRFQSQGLNRFVSPPDVDVEGQDSIQKVIPWSDLVEETLNLFSGFVEKGMRVIRSKVGGSWVRSVGS